MMNFIKKIKSNKKGFTLIELIIVIAILAVLMLILVPTMTGFVNTAKEQALQANAKAVYTAIKASDAAKVSGIKTSEARTTICAAASGTSELGTAYSDFWSGKLDGMTCTWDGTKVTMTDGKLTSTYPNS